MKSISLPSFFALVLLLLLPLRAAAETENLTAQNVAARLQENYESLATFTADFTQTTQVRLSRRQRHGAGTLNLLKPKYLRWDYSSPDRQVLISDGDTITMYFEKSRQMIVSAAADFLQSDVTYSFFTGSGDILRDFIINEAAGIDAGSDSIILELVPRKSHPQIERLYLWTTRGAYLIDRLQIVDHFDTVTDLSFSNIVVHQEKNDSITAEMFHFTPPPGTEIIKQ